MADNSIKVQQHKVNSVPKYLMTDDRQAKQAILTVPLSSNYRAKSEIVKNSTSLSTSNTNNQKSQKELQQKIDKFQNNLLSVSNKQIYKKNNSSYYGESELENDYGLKQSSTTGGGNHNNSQTQPKRKYFKKFNGMILDKITENQNTPNTKNNFQSVYATEFLDRIFNQDKSTKNILPQTLLNNSKKVEVLPSVHQKSLSNSYLLNKQAANNNIFQQNVNTNNSINSINSYKPATNQNIFSSTQDQQQIRQEYDLNKTEILQMDNLKTNETESDEINDQKKKILQGVQELKKLREQRHAQRKIKKMSKIQQRLSQLQELEKQIPQIENLNGELDEEKKKQFEKLLDNQDDSSSVLSSIGDDTLSRNDDDFIFKQLDQISVTDAGDQQQRMEEIDEVISQRSTQSKQNKVTLDQVPPIQLPSISQTNISTKSSKHSGVLQSIMEEHQDYFEHKAGKCACGQCHCGKCQVKCLINQKKPIFFEMKWQSSYNRFHNGNKFTQDSNNLNSINNLKIVRDATHSPQVNSQDYTSTFKNDYKYPSDISYNKVVKYDRIPESPLYSLSSYKVIPHNLNNQFTYTLHHTITTKHISNQCNYPDWKAQVPEHNKMGHQKTVLEGIPLTGVSTMKKDYQILDNVNTKMAQPPDQSPLPRYSINRYANQKQDFSSPNHEFARSDSFQSKLNHYYPVPSFEGQYTTSASKHYKIDSPNCEGTKKLYDQYQRKIEKYQQKLKDEIEKLQVK